MANSVGAVARTSFAGWVALLLLAVSCSLNLTGSNERIGLAWHVATAATMYDFWEGRPAVDGGKVFVQDGNQLLALDASSGSTLWSRPVRINPAPPPNVLLARNGRVYVSEVDSVLAVDEQTGHTIWNYRPGNQAAGVTPALDATTLYTGERGAPYVDAIALADGTERWRVNLGPSWPFWSAIGGLAVSGDTVYATGVRFQAQNGYLADGFLVAMDRATGRELWRVETDSGGYHGYMDEPKVAGNLLVVDDLRGNALVGIDRFTGREVWRYGATLNGPSQSEIANGVAYSAFANATAVAIDLANGKSLWTVPTPGSALGGGLCRSAFFVNDEGLRRFDAATGRATGELHVGTSDILTSQLVSDGVRVYVTGETGVFAANCG